MYTLKCAGQVEIILGSSLQCEAWKFFEAGVELGQEMEMWKTSEGRKVLLAKGAILNHFTKGLLIAMPINFILWLLIIASWMKVL